METKELLKPRFVVIADYPNSSYNVGDVLVKNILNGFTVQHSDKIDNFGVDESVLTKYPHLFRRLQWYEKRKVEEMPKYIKCTQFKEVYEIEHWDMVHRFGKIKGINYGCSFAYSMSTYLPATEKEYNDYITQ